MLQVLFRLFRHLHIPPINHHRSRLSPLPANQVRNQL
jgi:hypothetical protein